MYFTAPWIILSKKKYVGLSKKEICQK
jgi:hypothetical protein